MGEVDWEIVKWLEDHYTLCRVNIDFMVRRIDVLYNLLYHPDPLGWSPYSMYNNIMRI